MIQGFSGSYQPSDVQFLLRQLHVEVTDIAEKERLIQTGQKHYSEMLSAEPIPSAKHQQIYQQALDSYGLRMAQDIQALALALLPLQVNGELVLVSFVRYLGHRIEALMPAKDQRWVIDQIMATEVPEAVDMLQRGMKGVLSTEPRPARPERPARTNRSARPASTNSGDGANSAVPSEDSAEITAADD